MVRCFLAIDLDESLRDKVLHLHEKFKDLAEIKFVERENLHLTLWFFGEVNLDFVNSISKEVDEAVKHFKPFELHLKSIGAFPSIDYVRVIWIGVKSTELIELYNSLKGRLEVLGLREDKEFHPHLTIGRVRRVKNKEELISRIKELENLEIGKMKVSELKLKKSKLTSRGPIYEDLKIFKLI